AEVKTHPNRYNNTQMEKDEESGLDYHCARYYVVWLARWASPDPGGVNNGLNVYLYTVNPIRYQDPSGKSETTNLDNHDSFETVMKKAVNAYYSGTDDRDKMKRF